MVYRKHKLYDVFRGMLNRCNKENNKDYKNYGARGITKEWYLYIKAFKLVAVQEFYHYCNTQRGIDSKFDSCLSRILDEHYPPLEYEHSEEKGYPELPAYVQIARIVF